MLPSGLAIIRRAKGIQIFAGQFKDLVDRRNTSGMASNSPPLSDMRRAYNSTNQFFDEADLVSKEPFGNFRHWFEAASKQSSILEPNSMALATATKNGKPSVRMVLLKEFSENGFKFFTNYCSRKGKELTENPCASLLFYWEPLHRQVRVEGTVTELSEEEAINYFRTRPRMSQIGANVSNQSDVIKDRSVLEAKRVALLEEYGEAKPIPKPQHWGGYLLKPHSMEFWQGQTDRLHDRIVFRRLLPNEVVDPSVTKAGTDGWFYERLYP